MREEQRPLLRWTCEIIKEQANMGNYFIFGKFPSMSYLG